MNRLTKASGVRFRGPFLSETGEAWGMEGEAWSRGHGGKGMEQGAWSMGGWHDAAAVAGFLGDRRQETGDRNNTGA
ncbi:MAG: hypothetical protein LWW85_01025 [Marinilabiliales bacterium]|nr:hypothetical protein [Marinilabiliales bacterium]